jgi:hypothetical protein
VSASGNDAAAAFANVFYSFIHVFSVYFTETFAGTFMTKRLRRLLRPAANCASQIESAPDDESASVPGAAAGAIDPGDTAQKGNLA